jgi:hypothetical protein
MFGLTKLFNALSTLADNVLALSGTVAEANTNLRERLALQAPVMPLEQLGKPDSLSAPADAAESHPDAARGKRRREAA